MTTSLIFTVHDKVAQAFLDPFYGPNEAFGVRTFQLACKRPDHIFCQSPKDFSLYVIGSYDNTNGIIEPVDPHLVCNGNEVIK